MASAVGSDSSKQFFIWGTVLARDTSCHETVNIRKCRMQHEQCCWLPPACSLLLLPLLPLPWLLLLLCVSLYWTRCAQRERERERDREMERERERDRE